MTAFFLLCTNLGSVLSLLQGLDWLKKHGHTDKPVADQLANVNAAIKNPDTAKPIINATLTTAS